MVQDGREQVSSAVAGQRIRTPGFQLCCSIFRVPILALLLALA